MNDIIAGIDLGTTNSLIGVMDAGFPLLLANREGERLTPSAVYFPADCFANGEADKAVVGRAALRARAANPQRTVTSIKRLIGETNESGIVKIGGHEFSPEEISAMILRKLKSDAEAALEQNITRAVITVPAYFNDAQRSATKRAGELAGFRVERIVSEPTAAALAYGLDRLGEKSKIAVYDFGGGTFDISILELNAGVFQVVSTHGNTRLGGDDIDEAFMEWLRKKCEIDAEKFANSETRARLREIAVSAKHQLSDAERIVIDIPFLEETRSISLEISRAEFEEIARLTVEKTRAHCRRAMADAKFANGDLDAVILVGGSTRIPLVRELVREIFEREPDVSQHPDEAVALGATIQAGVLSGAVKNVVLLDVTPLSLGIETFGGLMNMIVPRNSTIPIKAGEMFTNAVAGQRSMLIHVLQGERELARDNFSLGKFELEFESAPKGNARVGVQFEIDADGILHVLARDTKTNREKIVNVTSAVDVSDEAVEKMISESVEHAFEDMSERVFVEAKIKAEEMLKAVQSALAQLGDTAGDEERSRLAKLISEVESAVAGHELDRLKRANAALDEGTQQIAALLMERAMEEALERKMRDDG